MLLDILIAATLAVNVIGGGILVKWLVRHIRALEGTVKAQGETLATVGKLNDTLVNVFKALDPDRWAKEVTVHKELADKKAAAIVEEAERKFREERTALTNQTVEGMMQMGEQYKEALEIALRFMPWVPKSHRALVIAETNLADSVKKTLTDMAGETADWSSRLGSLPGGVRVHNRRNYNRRWANHQGSLTAQVILLTSHETNDFRAAHRSRAFQIVSLGETVPRELRFQGDLRPTRRTRKPDNR